MIKADGNLLQTITRSNSSTSRTERISWEKRSNFTPKEDRLFIQSDVCYTKYGKDHPEGIYTCEYTHGNRLADTLIRIDGGVYDSQDRMIVMGAVADNYKPSGSKG